MYVWRNPMDENNNPDFKQVICVHRVGGSKTICMPCVEAEYPQLLEDNTVFKEYLDNMHLLNPEIFPKDMGNGYVLDGFTEPSKKLEYFRMRRIKILETGEVYTIRPSFVMPYMIAKTEDVEKALYLRKYAVHDEALTYVFGRDDRYWNRAERSFGRNSIVGTTIKESEKLPQDLVADEKVTNFNGDKICIAETVAEGCVLGAAVCKGNETTQLTEGYGIFAVEAKNVNPKYEPETVNTDGSTSTQAAWKAIFSNILVIRCFLHAFLNIRNYCKKQYTKLKQKIWHVYHAKQIFFSKNQAIKRICFVKSTRRCGIRQSYSSMQ